MLPRPNRPLPRHSFSRVGAIDLLAPELAVPRLQQALDTIESRRLDEGEVRAFRSRRSDFGAGTERCLPVLLTRALILVIADA
jgi:hypothetical protein